MKKILIISAAIVCSFISIHASAQSNPVNGKDLRDIANNLAKRSSVIKEVVSTSCTNISCNVIIYIKAKQDNNAESIGESIAHSLQDELLQRYGNLNGIIISVKIGNRTMFNTEWYGAYALTTDTGKGSWVTPDDYWRMTGSHDF